MIRVGIAGLGMMGRTHLEVYASLPDVEVVAAADRRPSHFTNESGVERNFDKSDMDGKGVDWSRIKAYADAAELINDPEVDVIDICLPTTEHYSLAQGAIWAGKPFLIEKPLCRSYLDASNLAALAESSNIIAMPAHCMRFWPGWTWLKEVKESGEFGPILSATFSRIAQHPGGKFYLDGERSGGAILDLHLHDTDFICYLLGTPLGVTSFGMSRFTSAIDHVVTHYAYDDIPLVMAEGSWSMDDGFGFQMQYKVVFERATAVFDVAKPEPLMLYAKGEEPRAISMPAVLGYDAQIRYFLDCVRNSTQPAVVNLRDGAESIRVVEAEVASIEQGESVALEGFTGLTPHERV